MKRTLCLILAAWMLALSFVSCSEKNAEQDLAGETTSSAPSAEGSVTEEETESAIKDDLPEMNFDGHTYTIYNTNSEANTWFTTTFVDFEEDSGEPIPSAIYNRNLAVEDRFNVVINEIYQTAAEVKQIIQAGSGDDMDLILLDGSDTISYITQKLIYDLNTLDYLDLNKPYWDQNSREYLTLGGKYYEGVGDFMTTHIDETICMYFNKGLITDYNLENPYELIDNMKWTYDKMHEMGINACNDADGNGVLNDHDSYALMSWSGVLYPFLIYGSGESYITKDENDAPVPSFYNDRFVAVFEKILDVCHSEGDTFLYDANIKANTMGLASNHRVQEIMFPNNQVLFWVECVSWARALREMETDFGIITAPMYNEEQGRYYNYCNGNYYGMCVPVTLVGDSLDRACIILEALTSHSTSTVLEAYYNVSLQSKYSRDEESGRMLDLIFSNRIFDVSIVFDVASINGSLYDMAAKNNKDIASYYNRTKKMTEKSIQKIMDSILED
ncbi:MAG: hypothetical protein ACI4V1_08965 [Eubacteriales bacterium]